MKIIGLNGSPRKSQSRTGQLVRAVLDSAQSNGAEIEYIDITNLKLNFCIGCGKCHKFGSCIQKDDFEALMNKVKAADALVVGSPVYIYSISAQLKVWMDRLGSTIIHCQELLGKYGAAVATSGNAGEAETVQYIKNSLITTGMQYVGEVAGPIEDDGPLTDNSPLMKQAYELGTSLVQAVKNKQEFPEQIEAHKQFLEFFRYTVIKNKESWAWEYKYWQDKGWL